MDILLYMLIAVQLPPWRRGIYSYLHELADWL